LARLVVLSLAYAPTGILPRMRLTQDQTMALRTALRASFGAQARLRVFGSRLDDRVRGGDYDLMVQTAEADPDRLVQSRLDFLTRLHATPAFEGEKVDVVLYAPALHTQPSPIQRRALAEGQELS
jgi:hypothetical protein